MLNLSFSVIDFFFTDGIVILLFEAKKKKRLSDCMETTAEKEETQVNKKVASIYCTEKTRQ